MFAAAAPASQPPAMEHGSFEQAQAAFLQEKFEDAKVICEELLRYRQCTDVLLLLGACCYQLRDVHKCIHYNMQAIMIDPNFPEAFGNMANAFKELGDLDNAILLYQKAIQLNPRFVDALSNLAAAFMQKEMYAEAVDAYQRTLALNPNLPDAQCSLGNLLKHTGDRAGAKRCYSNAIRLRPDYAIAWNNLAGACKDDGDVPNAISCYREVHPPAAWPHPSAALCPLPFAQHASVATDDGPASRAAGAAAQPDDGGRLVQPGQRAQGFRLA